MYPYYITSLLEDNRECFASTEVRGCKHSTCINILLNIVNDGTADFILVGRGLNSHWLHRSVCNNSVSNPSFTSLVDKMEGLQVLLQPVPLKTNTVLNVMFCRPEGNSGVFYLPLFSLRDQLDWEAQASVSAHFFYCHFRDCPATK